MKYVDVAHSENKTRFLAATIMRNINPLRHSLTNDSKSTPGHERVSLVVSKAIFTHKTANSVTNWYNQTLEDMINKNMQK